MYLPVPDMTIGPPTTRFGRIADVDASPDGAVFVLDSEDRVVSIFSSEGKLAGSLGGSNGRGPEFGRLLWQVLVGANDEVYVPDPLNLRVLVFRVSTQQVLREIALPEHTTFLNWALGSPGDLFVCAADLPVLDWLRRPELPRGHACSIPPTSEDLRDILADTPPAIIYRFQRGRLEQVLHLSPGRSASNVANTVEIFSPAFRMWAATGDGTLWIADARRRELLRYSSAGALLARYGIPLEPEAIRPEDRELIAQQYARSVLPRLFGTTRLPTPIESLIHFTVGGLAPPFRGFLLDSQGRAWLGMPNTVSDVLHPKVGVSEFDLFNRGTSRWTVLSKGEILASVEFSQGFRLTRVRGIHAYGFRVLHDEGGVIERYELPL